MPAQTVIKFRRDTASNWTSTDPTLASGEAGFESDTGKLKVGDGSTAWSSLGYISGGASVEVSDTAPASPEANTLWWESDTGTLFIYYDGYWVEAITGTVGPSGADGADNIVTSATAPANTDVLWIDTSEAGDAVLPLGGTTGQVLEKVDGSDYNTQWATPDDSPADIITTQGDLIVGGAGGAPERLASSGTEGDVLQVNATGGLEFATPSGGGWTLLSTTAFPTGASNLTITGIDQSYSHLKVRIEGLTLASSSYIGWQLKDSGGSILSVTTMNTTATYAWDERTGTTWLAEFSNFTSTTPIDAKIQLDDYSSTSTRKPVIMYGGGSYSATAGFGAIGMVNSTSAVSQLVIFAGVNFATGQVKIYGGN